jgi:hypothetical protein
MDVKTKMENIIKAIEQEQGYPEYFGSGCKVVPVSVVLGYLEELQALLDEERKEPAPNSEQMRS